MRFWIVCGPCSAAAVSAIISRLKKSPNMRESTVEKIAAKYGCTVIWR